ncbi:MAG: sugar phosphate isomerase/epimerase [Actinomycetota bacterium]|nr:sugar phosphate isomerase/epimerase [Actinomycetota bacterium]
MKISFCSIAFRKTDEPLTAIIPSLAEIGYDGVEIWGNHLVGDGSDITAVESVLTENNMSVPMISPYFNVTGSKSDWETTLAAAKVYFTYAEALKAPLLRAFTGFLGSEDVEPDAWRSATSRLRVLCDLAAEKDLAVALETHPRTLVDNVAAVHRLLEEVARANLVLNLDIYHMWEKHQDPLWIWEQLKPHVRHVHAKNALIPPSDGDEYPLFHDKQGLQEIGGVTYLSGGNMEYKPFIAALVRDGFSGWLSIEWFGSDPLVAAEHELRWVKSLLTDDARCAITKTGPRSRRRIR